MSEQVKQDKIISQLKRIRGQVDGIIKMYSNERDCLDIVHQVLAVRNSLGSVTKDLLLDRALVCSRENRLEELESVIKQLLKN